MTGIDSSVFGDETELIFRYFEIIDGVGIEAVGRGGIENPIQRIRQYGSIFNQCCVGLEGGWGDG